uniref:alanine racemase n=1 Tax=Alistipes sp. TaxID=1872444 RepID=UPI0040559E2E
MNYKLSEIAEITGGKLFGEDLQIREISTDSRHCDRGEGLLFVAIKGEHHDAHLFIEQMIHRGVKAFLVEHEVELPEGCGAVVCSASIAALQAMAAHHRSLFRGRVVAITGSNGKTIVKEWLAAALPQTLTLSRSPKSYNSQLGVALSLLMARGDEELVLIEAGISEPHEMARLERMIRPDLVIFTSLGEAHQENFSSLEEKGREKLSLAHRAKGVVYHEEDERVAHLIEELPEEVQRIKASVLPSSERIASVALTGGAARENLALVVAAANYLGYPLDLERLEPVAMRLELKQGINHSLLIDDAYNADLNSLRIALDYLHGVASERPTTLILSEIEQSGISSRELYRRVAEEVDRAKVDRLIGVGEALRKAAPYFHCKTNFYSTTEELLRHLHRDDFAHRVVLIKGARRSRLERVVHALEQRSHTTTLEVDLDAMLHNLNWFRGRLSPATRLVAMVKASSYGAGDYEVAQMLQHQGVDYLAVAFADEGILLRESGITMPIVVLNADEGSFPQMVEHRLEPEIYNLRSLEYFRQTLLRVGERAYPIHLKLDTGMHRLGFTAEEIDPLLEALSAMQELRVASIFSHLNCADDPEKDDYTREQIARFELMSSRILRALPYPVLRHTANSAAIERFPKAHFDMCRLGLGLYGFGFEHNDQLRPVSTLKTRIVQIKHLKAGEAVGYGREGMLTRDTLTATIPVGYADGLDRHLGSGRWSVLIQGKPAPIIGRICMDSCMVDVTPIDGVKEGDEVVIFSPTKGNDLESMARQLGTISYEIMTSISNRVKRIYTKE